MHTSLVYMTIQNQYFILEICASDVLTLDSNFFLVDLTCSNWVTYKT